MSDLAARQAALVAALVCGGAPPAGFDPDRLRAATAALLRKRAGEVAATWPLLAASLTPHWTARFTAWAAGRPPAGPLRDGWDLARQLLAAGSLTGAAPEELAARESWWRYDGVRPPRPRRWPAIGRAGPVAVLRLGDRIFRLPRRRGSRNTKTG
ncbi:MAG TPA: hypothetical protein VFB84_05725 [Micromonosporaceae bacterium]|nr:hypothetical protein [Micromonosporaceae bacterium]